MVTVVIIVIHYYYDYTRFPGIVIIWPHYFNIMYKRIEITNSISISIIYIIDLYDHTYTIIY